jgi:HD-like signal output (HDOD) protein
VELSSEPRDERAPQNVDDRHGRQRAARSLAATVAKVHGAVPLPDAAQRLLAVTEATDFEVVEVVQIIETDPGLTGRLIQHANSALGGRACCASVTQAVTLLGVKTLRSVALAATALELFGQDEEPVAAAIAQHARRVGAIARFLSPHCGLAADEMYTCGLLLDVGKLMLLRAADADYCELLARDHASSTLHLEERHRYGFDHAVLAGHVLTSWKLPHPLPRVIAWHHQPGRAYRAAGKLPAMVALVRVADELAYTDLDPTPTELMATMLAMPDELAVLAFSADVLPNLCTELAREIATPEPAPQPAQPEPAPAAEVAPVAPPAPVIVIAPAPVRAAHREPRSPPRARHWAASAGNIVAAAFFVGGASFGWLSTSRTPGLAELVAGILILVACVLLWRASPRGSARAKPPSRTGVRKISAPRVS